MNLHFQVLLKNFFTSCRDYLLSLKTGVVVSTFQEEEINSIDFLLNDDCWMTKVPTFVKLIWFHAFQMIETTSSKTKMTLLLSSDGKNFLRQLTSWISFSMVTIFLCMFVLFLAQTKVHFLNGPLHVSCEIVDSASSTITS